MSTAESSLQLLNCQLRASLGYSKVESACLYLGVEAGDAMLQVLLRSDRQ